MKSLFTKILFLFALLCSPLLATAQDNTWLLKTETEGIKIYNRTVPHSRIKELKMTTTVKTSLSALVHILNEVHRYPEWMPGCKGAELVNYDPMGTPCYMTTIQFPKPLAWRVMFTKNVVTQDPRTKVVTLKTVAVKNNTFDDDNFVVMKDVKTSWILRPVANGLVEIESYLFCDPSGNIPYWVVNSLLDRGPLKTIQRLLKRLKQPEFVEVEVDGIRE
jgi:ribosome-associated toxin RatA of RatAB toxin-antitoxin module